MSVPTDPTILKDFAEESRELVSRLRAGLSELSRTRGDAETINQVFRAWHTIKGCAGFLELHTMTALAHAAEGALNAVRHGAVSLDDRTLAVLSRAADETERQIEEVEAGRAVASADDAVMSALCRLAEGKSLGEPIAGVPAASESFANGDRSRGADEPVDQRVNPACAVASPASEETDEPRYIAPASDSIIQVPVARFDAMMDIAERMRQSSSAETAVQATCGAGDESRDQELSEALAKTARTLDRIARDLSTAIAAARMLPLRRVFSRCEKIAAEVCSASGKRIRVEVSCGGIEVDQPVARVIGESLVHLVRNAADHGIEPAEERAAAGKPRDGSIRVRANLSGGRLVIEIRDDGRGLSRARIGSVAVKRGIATGEQVRAMSDEEVFAFVFEPGFSTAERVTEVSGRGIGMDAVRAGVERMRGTISLSSTCGKGTKVTLSIPIAAARVEAVVLERNGSSFALWVRDIVRVSHHRGVRRQKSTDSGTSCRLPILEYRCTDASDHPSAMDEKASRWLVAVTHGDRAGAIRADRVHSPERITLRSGPRQGHADPARGLLAVARDGRVIELVEVDRILTNRVEAELESDRKHNNADPALLGHARKAPTE